MRRHRQHSPVIVSGDRVEPRLRVPAHQRDVLTGAPLEPGTLRLVVRSYDPSRPEGARPPIPYDLHNRRDERLDTPGISHDRLGSFEFSGPFLRYMKHAPLPTPEHQRRMRWVHWYEVRGVSDFLQVRFSPDQIGAVMAVAHGADWVATAAAYGKSPGWLMRLESRMASIVRREFLLAA